MTRDTSVHSHTGWLAVAVSILGLAVLPAYADAVTVTLDDLTFSTGFSQEVFSGSFVYDAGLNTISAITVAASGATDPFNSNAPLAFGGVVGTGSEPYEFAFTDGISDTLLLFLSQGGTPYTYGSGDAYLYGYGFVGAALTYPYPSPVEGYASAGSFTVASPPGVPEPSSGVSLLMSVAMLACAGLKRSRTLGGSMPRLHGVASGAEA